MKLKIIKNVSFFLLVIVACNDNKSESQKFDIESAHIKGKVYSFKINKLLGLVKGNKNNGDITQINTNYFDSTLSFNIDIILDESLKEKNDSVLKETRKLYLFSHYFTDTLMSQSYVLIGNYSFLKSITKRDSNNYCIEYYAQIEDRVRLFYCTQILNSNISNERILQTDSKVKEILKNSTLSVN